MQTSEHTGRNEQRLLSNVRIIYIPPATVAATYYFGQEPRERAGRVLDDFVRDRHLYSMKPDIRHYGFSVPGPFQEEDDRGYEMWVTIPDHLDVPEPLVKKWFGGGLYAAYAVQRNERERWRMLVDWVQRHHRYELNNSDGEYKTYPNVLEEHLNYISHVFSMTKEPEDTQLDLLIPIREKHYRPIPFAMTPNA